MTGDGDLATLLVTFGVVFVGVLSVAYLFGTKPAKAPVKKPKRKEKKQSSPPPQPKKNGHSEPSGSAGASAPRQPQKQTSQPKRKRNKKKKSQSPPPPPQVEEPETPEPPTPEPVGEEPSDDGWTVVAEEKPRRKKEKKPTVVQQPDVDVVECGGGAAAVVGRGGETIKRIETSTGAKLNLDKKNQTCEITGSIDERKKAKALVLEALEKAGHGPNAPRTTSCTVDGGSSVNKVIGSGGSTIKYIQETSGAKVDTGRDSSVITISGTPQQISDARALVERALKGEDVAAATSHTIDLGARGARILVGKQGAAIKVLRENHPVRFDVRRGDGRGTSRDTCIISGDADEVTEAVVALNALLSDHSSSETLTLACRVGAILGKGGQTITKIQDASGADLDVQAQGSDECLVKVTGTNAQVAAAKRLVLKACEASKAPPPVPPGEVRETLPVPDSCRGAVVGRGGATISSIQSETGARLDLVDGADGTGSCVITGKKDAVADALERVKTAVEKHEAIAARDAARRAPAPAEGEGGAGFDAVAASADDAWATPEGEDAWGA